MTTSASAGAGPVPAGAAPAGAGSAAVAAGVSAGAGAAPAGAAPADPPLAAATSASSPASAPPADLPVTAAAPAGAPAPASPAPAGPLPEPDAGLFVVVRPGRPADVPELLAIYNYEIEHSVSPLHLEPRTLEQWEQWFADHQDDRHPLVVAEAAGRVAGYACLSSFRAPAAYLTTAELSIYVRRDVRGRGVATLLMDGILGQARAGGRLRAVVSHITGDNEPSLQLHRKMGFELCGTLREAAFKFGRYHDVHVYQLMLEEG